MYGLESRMYTRYRTRYPEHIIPDHCKHSHILVPGIQSEENLVVNKGELLTTRYIMGILILSLAYLVVLLVYMHVPNLVALRVQSVLGSVGTVYAGNNTNYLQVIILTPIS